MGLKEICANTRNWTDSAEHKDYWRDLVNAALNLRVGWLVSYITLNLRLKGSNRPTAVN